MGRQRWRRWLASALPGLGAALLLGVALLADRLTQAVGGPWGVLQALFGRFGGWGFLASLLVFALVVGGLGFAVLKLVAWSVRRLVPRDQQ